MHPGEKFCLDISCSLIRVVLAQYLGSCYVVINSELGVTIFNAILCLLNLYILRNTQTGQFNLWLDISKDTFSRTSNARLKRQIQYVPITSNDILITSKRLWNPILVLQPANQTFPAGMVSIATDVATDPTLCRVIPWATVCIDPEPHLLSWCPMMNFDRLLVGWPIVKIVKIKPQSHNYVPMT